MQFQTIDPSAAPTPVRESKYAPVIRALQGGQGVKIGGGQGATQNGLRAAVNRHFGTGSVRVFTGDDGTIYAVPQDQTADEEPAGPSDAPGGHTGGF